LTVHKARNPNGLERPEDWAIMDDGQIIAECFGISGYRKDAPIYQHQPAEANARLFAAAPELLAALQTIADSEETAGESFVCDFSTLQSVARAAIAKALP
jgi:hypothetical protein